MALSTIGTAAIADDAITAAKIDDDGTGFTVGDLTVGNITSTGVTTGFVSPDSLLLDGSSVATVTVNSAVSASATIVVDGVSGTIVVGMVVNVSDTTVRSISDASSETAVSVDDTLTITAVASQTSFTVSEAVTIADNVVLILRANESENFVLDASAASTDVGEKIQFEDATNDGSIAANNVAPTLLNVVGSLSNTVTIPLQSPSGLTQEKDKDNITLHNVVAKQFVKFKGDTAAVFGVPEVSFNTSSVADLAAGHNRLTYINNFTQIHYVVHSTTGNNYGVANDGWSSGVDSNDGSSDITTSTCQLSHGASGGSNADPPQCFSTILGDLA
jgi:hypothetical protein